MLDPGHGGNDPGAVGNGLKEKDINLKIAKLAKEYLDTYYEGHDTVLTRTGDTTMSLKDRTDQANMWGADLFLSIHVNAGGGTGYEDFIHTSLSDTSKTAAIRDVIHRNIADAMVWRNRGKKKANFHVLRETSMSAMLTENGFIDNEYDAQALSTPSYLYRLATAHGEGLAKAFNLKKKNITKNKLYKVQVGAFVNRKNAEMYAERVRKDGYDTYIVEE